MDKHNIGILLNSINCFPAIAILSSMKFLIKSMGYSTTIATILSYAGLVSVIKFLLVHFTHVTKIFNINMLPNKQWIFFGQLLSSSSFLLMIIGLKYPILLFVIAPIVIFGEAINDVAVSNIQSYNKTSNKIWLIFLGHKICVFLGYGFFCFLANIIGWKFTIIVYGLLGILLSFSAFLLPDIQYNYEESNKSFNTLTSIKESIKSLNKPYTMFTFIFIGQAGLFLLHGILHLLILNSYKGQFVNLLRIFYVFFGILGGWLSKKFKSKINKSMGLFVNINLFIILINYCSIIMNKIFIFIIVNLIESVLKGFIMMCLMDFFYDISNGKTSGQLLTILWGVFSVSRYFLSAISGFILDNYGILGIIILSIVFWIINLIIYIRNKQIFIINK